MKRKNSLSIGYFRQRRIHMDVSFRLFLFGYEDRPIRLYGPIEKIISRLMALISCGIFMFDCCHHEEGSTSRKSPVSGLMDLKKVDLSYHLEMEPFELRLNSILSCIKV